MGVVQPRTAFQLEEPDTELKTRLWNVLDDTLGDATYARAFVVEVWRSILVRPVDTIVSAWPDFRKAFMSTSWSKLYEIVELAGRDWGTRKDLQEALELGGSGYRFVDDQLVPVTDEQQIREIEDARARTAAPPLAGVRKHLDQALAHLADRDSPDHRNSIKESISALEGLVNLINHKTNGKSGATLGDALKALKDMGGEFHPAMSKALSGLYGWTNDGSGIRHYLKDEGSPGVEEARFMLVTVSAFVNFLVAKAAKMGIDLSK